MWIDVGLLQLYCSPLLHKQEEIQVGKGVVSLRHRTGGVTTLRLPKSALELIRGVQCKVDTVRAVNVTSYCKVNFHLQPTLE